MPDGSQKSQVNFCYPSLQCIGRGKECRTARKAERLTPGPRLPYTRAARSCLMGRRAHSTAQFCQFRKSIGYLLAGQHPKGFFRPSRWPKKPDRPRGRDLAPCKIRLDFRIRRFFPTAFDPKPVLPIGWCHSQALGKSAPVPQEFGAIARERPRSETVRPSRAPEIRRFLKHKIKMEHQAYHAQYH